MQDHYKTLRVNPRDNAEQIRAAYRRLVRELHPDMAGPTVDNKQFAAVADAYRVLSDPDQRRKYDALRLVRMMLPVKGLLDAMEDPLIRSKVATKIAGGLHRISRSALKKAAIEGRDMTLTKQITFPQSYTGTKLTVAYQRPMNCHTCEGTGWETYDVCQTCSGRGVIPLGALPGLTKRCPQCGGKRVVGEGKCVACEGIGQKQTSTEVTVGVPAGVTDKTKLKVNGKGEEGRFGGRDGDLLLQLQVDGSLVYGREGLNLVVMQPTPLAVAVRGGILRVALPDDTTLEINAPPRLYQGRVLRVRDRGFADPAGAGKGELLVEVDVVLPDDLNSQQRETAMEWLHQARQGEIAVELEERVNAIILGGT